MKSPLLVLDSHYLCHRAFHAQSNLSWNGRATGVIFGFLKGIGPLKDEFRTDRIAFCFEGTGSLRKEQYPEYKGGVRSKQRSVPEQKAYDALHSQILQLRTQYLPKIGFRNIFCFDGLESDDIMASIAKNPELYGECILVTSDSDLYQCLSPTCSIFSPQKMKLLTEDWFRREYGIRPSKWAVVKAIAGCHTDNVKGVGGVGESTAIKYVKNLLPHTHKAFWIIQSKRGREIIRRNKNLVKLPLSCPAIEQIFKDDISPQGWKDVCHELGMRSLAGQPPVSSRELLGGGLRNG